MEANKKDVIIKILETFPDERFSITQLFDYIKEQMSYPTLLKWIMVLEAEKRIIIEDYGNVKIIRLNKGDARNG